MNTSSLIQKIWNFCHTLRDDGLGYGDYLEQLTFLLFLKMADESVSDSNQAKPVIPSGLDWSSLRSRNGTDLEAQYLRILLELGKQSGMLGAIFFKAQNKIQDPAKLSRLIQLIDAENWLQMGTDVKGDLYEGLLRKNAEDTKSGAGQYFTPRPLIRAMVECLRPLPMKTVADPACGTGGFFLAVYDWFTMHREAIGGSKPLTKKQRAFLHSKTFHGWEIVPGTRRLCLMNLVLHNIGGMETDPSIRRDDALLHPPGQTFDYVLANPPFGKKSSMTFTTDEGDGNRESLVYQRQDFWETTSNKQLNFLQHIRSMLKPDGQAAVVLPDNVLFEGGAGEKIRRKLLERCDVHTILRLPTGIFYANGVKANVVFFDNHADDGKAYTSGIWFYDLRTNQHFSLKTRPMKYEDMQDFIRCYNPENRHKRESSERFRFFSMDEVLARDKASLDVFWLKDKSLDSLENLPEPEVLAQEIIQHMESALEHFRAMAAALAHR